MSTLPFFPWDSCFSCPLLVSSRGQNSPVVLPFYGKNFQFVEMLRLRFCFHTDKNTAQQYSDSRRRRQQNVSLPTGAVPELHALPVCAEPCICWCLETCICIFFFLIKCVCVCVCVRVLVCIESMSSTFKWLMMFILFKIISHATPVNHGCKRLYVWWCIMKGLHLIVKTAVKASFCLSSSILNFFDFFDFFPHRITQTKLAS